MVGYDIGMKFGPKHPLGKPLPFDLLKATAKIEGVTTGTFSADELDKLMLMLIQPPPDDGDPRDYVPPEEQS